MVVAVVRSVVFIIYCVSLLLLLLLHLLLLEDGRCALSLCLFLLALQLLLFVSLAHHL